MATFFFVCAVIVLAVPPCVGAWLWSWHGGVAGGLISAAVFVVAALRFLSTLRITG